MALTSSWDVVKKIIGRRTVIDGFFRHVAVCIVWAFFFVVYHSSLDEIKLIIIWSHRRSHELGGSSLLASRVEQESIFLARVRPWLLYNLLTRCYLSINRCWSLKQFSRQPFLNLAHRTVLILRCRWVHIVFFMWFRLMRRDAGLRLAGHETAWQSRSHSVECRCRLCFHVSGAVFIFC